MKTVNVAAAAWFAVLLSLFAGTPAKAQVFERPVEQLLNALPTEWTSRDFNIVLGASRHRLLQHHAHRSDPGAGSDSAPLKQRHFVNFVVLCAFVFKT